MLGRHSIPKYNTDLRDLKHVGCSPFTSYSLRLSGLLSTSYAKLISLNLQGLQGNGGFTTVSPAGNCPEQAAGPGFRHFTCLNPAVGLGFGAYM